MTNKKINRRIFLIGIVSIFLVLFISLKSFLQKNQNKKNWAMVEFEGWILTISDKDNLLTRQVE